MVNRKKMPMSSAMNERPNKKGITTKASEGPLIFKNSSGENGMSSFSQYMVKEMGHG
jgi:hypothetical protein